MSEKMKNTQNAHVSTSKALDDEQRVRVLSPGMLVAKRFFRNKLAVVGLGIIIFMFLFSFVGGLVSPYTESQVFRTTEKTYKDYAGVSYVKDFQYTLAEEAEFPGTAQAKMVLAIGKGDETFEAKDVTYTLVKHDENLYQAVELEEVVSVISLRGVDTFTATGDLAVTAELKEAYGQAVSAGESAFTYEGKNYYITKDKRNNSISALKDVAMASKLIFSPLQSEEQLSYEFCLNAQLAMIHGEKSFTAEGVTYSVDANGETDAVFAAADGTEYAYATNLIVNPTGSTPLSAGFKAAVQEAIEADKEEFTYVNKDGEEEDYVIKRKNEQFTVRRYEEVTVNDIYAAPSSAHLVGTDGNGMDMLTRLMYGGRISLTIGFITIIIELFIGVLIGGIAGFFGGWIDTMLMRVVDIFYCIPAIPLYLILGSIMDYYQVDPKIRIYLLCVILGLLTWVQPARIVRGQILSLREQEFMTAAEATGISIPRRIFKHLIPNVIPQLIVIATMGLGDVILTEATLSFLGLGVKFPCASWGNIVNAVNDSYVMTNFIWVWIPAGLLILLTVLGFNFIGDGLRDAFDPKMKR